MVLHFSMQLTKCNNKRYLNYKKGESFILYYALNKYQIPEGYTFNSYINEAVENIRNGLSNSGYTNVHFNRSRCDNVKRQDLCYLLLRDGVNLFNVADEI